MVAAPAHDASVRCGHPFKPLVRWIEPQGAVYGTRRLDDDGKLLVVIMQRASNFAVGLALGRFHGLKASFRQLHVVVMIDVKNRHAVIGWECVVSKRLGHHVVGLAMVLEDDGSKAAIPREMQRALLTIVIHEEDRISLVRRPQSVHQQQWRQ